MIDEVLDKKIRQMHAALGALKSEDLSVIKPDVGQADGKGYCKVNFTQDADEAELSNAAALLVGNIASIKDYLKVWCKKNGVPFRGDALIESNRAVALVHDLWNVDKHAELSSPPRSGHIPKLRGLSKKLRLSTGKSAGSLARIEVDVQTGKLTKYVTGTGSASIAIVAEIVDESGYRLGDFGEICTEAVEQWEKALSAARVPLS